jgi:hypothetical protein
MKVAVQNVGFGGKLRACALAVGPVLVTAGYALHPTGDESGTEFVGKVAAHPSQWAASHICIFAGMLTLLAGLPGLFRLAEVRGRALLAVGIALVSVGGLAMAMDAIGHGYLAFTIAERSDIAPSFAATIDTHAADSAWASTASLLGIFFPVGVIVTAGAVVRIGASRVYAALLFLGVVGIGAVGAGPFTVLATAPLVVGFAGLARASVAAGNGGGLGAGNRRVIAVAATMLLCLTAVVAAAASASTAAPVVHVRVDQAGIHAPPTLRPGVTTFAFSVKPGTDQSGSLQLVRLNPGVTYPQVVKYMTSGNLPEIFKTVSGNGGVSHSGIRAGVSWTASLKAGRYMLVDDEAHLIAPIVVQGTPRVNAAPQASGTVSLTSRGAVLPRSFGDGTWKFVNDDSISHEFALIEIKGGHSRAQALAALASGKHPAWLPPVGTLNALGPHEVAWYTLRGLRGDYLLNDYLPQIQGAAPRPIAIFHRFS